MQVSTIAPSEKLFQRYQTVRQTSEAICKPLIPEDYVVQPQIFVSPPKWHLAHTTWFFETFFLVNAQANYQVFDPDFSYLFNSYYEHVGERVLRVNRGNISRPGVEQVYAYRHYVDEHIQAYLQNVDELSAELSNILEIGLQHEQQHQELMRTDIKYILGHNPIFPKYQSATQETVAEYASIPGFFEMPEGLYKIGYEGKNFCFDNELAVHQVHLPAFRMAKRVVSNAEYLDFIEAGAYQDFRYWLSAGWDWVQQNNITAPMYWHKIEGEWKVYQLRGGLAPLDLQAPVTHISFYEADAYARWRGMRLPTEFEWEAVCKHFNPTANALANFAESAALRPIICHLGEESLLGNVWEWTNSAYLPYPHFKTAEGALGEYNGKFMNGQMVLRGGSCATSRNHIRPTYRNFFYSEERWQFTGIRLAEYL